MARCVAAIALGVCLASFQPKTGHFGHTDNRQGSISGFWSTFENIKRSRQVASATLRNTQPVDTQLGRRKFDGAFETQDNDQQLVKKQKRDIAGDEDDASEYKGVGYFGKQSQLTCNPCYMASGSDETEHSRSRQTDYTLPQQTDGQPKIRPFDRASANACTTEEIQSQRQTLDCARTPQQATRSNVHSSAVHHQPESPITENIPSVIPSDSQPSRPTKEAIWTYKKYSFTFEVPEDMDVDTWESLEPMKNQLKNNIDNFEDAFCYRHIVVKIESMMDARTFNRTPVELQDQSLSRAETLRMVDRLIAGNERLLSGVTSTRIDKFGKYILMGHRKGLCGGLGDVYMALLQERSTAAGLRELFVSENSGVKMGFMMSTRQFEFRKFINDYCMDDIRKYDRIYVPCMKLMIHMYLVVIDMRMRSITFYDSDVSLIKQALGEGRALTNEEICAILEDSLDMLDMFADWAECELQLARAIDRRVQRHKYHDEEAYCRAWTLQRAHIGNVGINCTEEEMILRFPDVQLAGNPVSRAQWTRGQCLRSPQQFEADDCGMFTVRVAEALSRSQPICTIAQETIDNDRAEVLEAIKLGRLPGDTGVLRPIFAPREPALGFESIPGTSAQSGS